MDVLSKLLMSVDAIKSQFSSWNKRDADDYYEVVAPVDEQVLKLNDGSMLTFFELRGFSRMLSPQEKRDVSRRIERSLDGYLPNPGYFLQIVDLSDPELTRSIAEESMRDSLDELKNIGIDHPILTTDYLDFIAENSVWKKQYIVVQTSPLSLKKDKVVKEKEDDMSRRVLHLKSTLADKFLKEPADSQALFSSTKERSVFKNHLLYYNAIYKEFSKEGALLVPMDVGPALRVQKRAIYGKSTPSDWEPSLSHINVSKSAETDKKKGEVKIDTPRMVEQVLSQGGTEDDLPPDVLAFGDRLFTTISMVVPQQDDGQLKSYQYIASRIPKELGYMLSFRMTSSPYSYSGYNVEQFYTGLSTVLPMTDNLLIRRARTEMNSQHDNGEKTSVYLQVTVTVFSNNLEKLQNNRNEVNKILAGWNRAQFRNVEMDKTQGLFDGLPGVTKKSHLKQVMENFADTLYQSPLFMSGVIYDSGYLHLFTEDGQPFPIEEHSSRNINYNVYLCGTPGSGKSTLLTLLNLALLAKPKTNPELKGELPVNMDVDFGKTSFGFKELLRSLTGEKKKHLYLLHEFTTEITSSLNPHDLTIGRTTPTSRQKEMLVRFLLVLLGGVKKDKSGNFEIQYPALEPMVKYMVDTVYAYRQESSTPHMYRAAEFKHPQTIQYMKRLGIEPNQDYSYFSLADLVMEKEPMKGAYHAMILRRYAVPRLGDYSTVLTNNPEIGARYKEGVIANGKSPLSFFLDRLGDVISEFPCFSRPTRVALDVARMISFDIKNVCGESDYRKAVFGSLCMMAFMVKRENLEESPDLLDGVSPQYTQYLKRLDKVNRVLPGSLNIEEAHMLFSLFDDLMISAQRHNRKGGWGMRTLSQNFVDPSDTFFSMCSTVFVASEQTGEEVTKRLNSIQASREEQRAVSEDLHNRTVFLYIKTKPSSGGLAVKRIAIKLKASISSGLIWFSNSEQVDRDFRDAVFERIGYQEGLSKLAKFYYRGSVRSYYENEKLKNLAKRRGKDAVRTLLLDEITENESPSAELSRWL